MFHFLFFFFLSLIYASDYYSSPIENIWRLSNILFLLKIHSQFRKDKWRKVNIPINSMLQTWKSSNYSNPKSIQRDKKGNESHYFLYFWIFDSFRLLFSSYLCSPPQLYQKNQYTVITERMTTKASRIYQAIS